jgi:hypothetical protein
VLFEQIETVPFVGDGTVEIPALGVCDKSTLAEKINTNNNQFIRRVNKEIVIFIKLNTQFVQKVMQVKVILTSN